MPRENLDAIALVHGGGGVHGEEACRWHTSLGPESVGQAHIAERLDRREALPGVPAVAQHVANVPHAIYHRDGPRALIHFNELMDMSEIHMVSSTLLSPKLGA